MNMNKVQTSSLSGRILGTVFRASLAGLMVSASFLAPAYAKYTIIDSRVPSLKPGQSIEYGEHVSLKQGQRLTLIGANGKTLTLRGPFDGPVTNGGNSGGDRKSALAALVATRDARTSSVGVIRAGGDPAKLPDPWLIDIGFAGTKCLLEGSKPVWWRLDTSKEEQLQVSPTNRSWKAMYLFPAGADSVTVYDELPIKPVNVLFLKVGNKEFGVQLLQVPEIFTEDPVVLTGWMLEKGCVQQANALIDKLAREEGGAAQ